MSDGADHMAPSVDAGMPDPRMVSSAVAQLASRTFFGAVWLDARLVVTHKLGCLADFVAIGDPVSSSIVVLIGHEDQILKLGVGAGEVLNIPNVAFVGADGPTARMNVSVCRCDDRPGYLVLLGRVLSADVRDLVLEDEIRKRRIADAELARINARLEEFAYVISHDLKAPLRALRYLVGDVEDALARKRIDAAGARAAVEGVKAQVQRMSNMLVGLLEYSRVGREQNAVEEVETGTLADEIISSIGARQTLIIRRAGDWPVIRTVMVPFDVVLRNLIENAVKHHDRADGTVTVTATPARDHLRVSVADDGAGIPTEWQEAIFEPFKRVSDEPSSESSGIGLALVRRTIETIGGRIEVRSDPAARRGTEFVVTWPLHITHR